MLPSASALASRREERVRKAFSVDHHGPGNARLSHGARGIYGELGDTVDAAEEEPAAEKPAVEKPYLWLSPLLVALCPRVRRELEAKLSQIDAKYEAKEAERQAKCEADKEKRRLVGLQRAEELATELAERAERAERAEPVCVCVCGKCRKDSVSPLASPLGSQSVATFNAKV